MICLDHHIAPRPCSKAIDTCSSLCKDPQRSKERFSSAAAAVKLLLGAQENDHCFFFSGGGEAVHHLFLSTYIDFIRQTGRTQLIAARDVESPVKRALERLEQLGCAIRWLPLNAQGQLVPEALAEAIRPRTSLVTLSWANALTGVIQPLHDLARVCREKEAFLHVEASHVIGKIPFRFQDLGVEFLSFDGASLQAPPGVGALLAKAGSFFQPSTWMEPIPAAALLSTVLEEREAGFDHLCTETIRLRDSFEQIILSAWPEAQLLISSAERLPHISAIAFPGVSSESLSLALQRKAIAVSRGGGRFQILSELLMQYGIDPFLAHCSLSFGFAPEISQADVEKVAEEIVAAAIKLRSYSQQLCTTPRK